MTHDDTAALAAVVREAYDRQTPLEIVGGGTRRHLGRTPDGQPLSLANHLGIVEYEPSGFVVTVRAGTTLHDLDAALAREGQKLMVDIPRFSSASTVGGAIAAGFTGPGRPYTGALRDSVLGARIISGTGQVLAFGGKVLKNVAGFDVSRLMVGAFGTLGVVLDVSLRVGRCPEDVQVVEFEMPWADARERLKRWEGDLPLTGAFYHRGVLSVRLAGREARVTAAVRELGGEKGRPEAFTELRDLALDVFQAPGSLWRLLLPPDSPWDPEGTLIDWAGAQRFWVTRGPAQEVREKAAQYGGQAVRVWGPDRSEGPWAAPPAATMALLTRVKAALDPQAILNRGRLYPDW